ncbi:hypothetical protein OUL59_003300 [Salmonella enterica subsp. enterica serovar Hato]|nr:hypothetical protein [Salmonella enterica]
MPVYELPQDAIYGPEKNKIEQPEPEYGDSVAPSLYEMFTPSNTGEKLRAAAFRTDNSMGSWVASAPFSQFEEVEGYNPFANDAGELKGYEDYADSFIDSGSPQETAAIKQRIDQQIQDKQYLQEAGGAGTVSSLAMGMIDPINVAAMFVPGGAVAKGAKFAETATKAALSGAAGSVASEAMFHATQETRTLEESMMNITVDAMVSGILGGSASLIADYTARKALNDSVKSTLEGTDAPRSIGAAEVATTTMDQEQLAGLGLVNKTLSVAPGGRLAQSPSYTARTTGQMLAENNYFYAKNDEGLATFSATETAVKRYKAVTAKTYETVKDSYKAYSKTAPSNRMSQTEFYEEIGKAMRRGDSHIIPEINQAASQLRPVFEQLKTRMQELGMLPEDVKVKTAESYLPRIYQFDKITSDRTGFKKIIADWLEGNNARVVEKANGKFEKTAALIKRSEDATQQAPVLESEILEAERWAGKKTLLLERHQKLSTRAKKSDELVKDLEKRKSELKSRKYSEKTRAIKERKISEIQQKLEKLELTKSEVARLQRNIDILDDLRHHRTELKNLKKQAGALERRNARQDKNIAARTPMTRQEVDSFADEIVNKIIGAPSGIVPKELLPEGLVKRAGFTKGRTLNIPDERIEDYLESDISFVMESYIEQIAPEIELTAKFGRRDMGEQIRKISEEYNELISAAKTPKERAALEKQRRDDIRDVEAMRDRLLGTYGAPKDPSSFFVRAGRIMRNVNFLRLLGGMAISSFTDLARPIMQHGLRSSLPVLGAMITNMGKLKIARQDLKEMAIGLETVLSTRTRTMADLANPYSRRSYVERGLKWSTQKFGNWTLMNQWNDTLKAWNGLTVQSRILKNAEKLASGEKLSKGDIRKMAQLGIDENMLHRISSEFKTHGEDLDGLLTGHSNKWDDPVVRDTFQNAVLKDTDSSVVTPGIGDTPLMMSSETGKMIMQFKTFIFAAHNRVLVSGIQQGDAAFYTGALIQVALGAMVYAMKQKLSGREVDTSPGNLVKEGLDRAGMIGWMSEPLNALENVSGGRFGLGAMFGAPPMSRYQNRNAIGALLGPSFDLGGDISNVAGGVLNGEFDDKQIHATRKVLPFQNLFWIAPLLNNIEEQLKE